MTDRTFEQAMEEADRRRVQGEREMATGAFDLGMAKVETETVTEYLFQGPIRPVIATRDGDQYEVDRVTIREDDNADEGPWHDVIVRGWRLTKAGKRDERGGYGSVWAGLGVQDVLYEMHVARQTPEGPPLPGTAFPSHGSDLPPAPKTHAERSLLLAHLAKMTTPASGHGHGEQFDPADLQHWSDEAIHRAHQKVHYQEGG